MTIIDNNDNNNSNNKDNNNSDNRKLGHRLEMIVDTY